MHHAWPRGGRNRCIPATENVREYNGGADHAAQPLYVNPCIVVDQSVVAFYVPLLSVALALAIIQL